MQTHEDSSHNTRKLLEALAERADQMTQNGQSKITAGKDGEEPLAIWESGEMEVRHLPDDEHGVLRISLGGMPSDHKGLKFQYLVFRGTVSECERLLRKALTAVAAYK